MFTVELKGPLAQKDGRNFALCSHNIIPASAFIWLSSSNMVNIAPDN